MAHHGKPVSSRPILVRKKNAADLRRSVEDRKEVRRYVDSFHLLGHASPADIEAWAREGISAYVLEPPRILFQSHELRDGRVWTLAVAEFEKQPHRPVRLAVGKGL